MNGYSDVIKDLHVRFYCNYLQETPPANIMDGHYWIRLSTVNCLSGGQNWNELNVGPTPPSAGYAPVALPYTNSIKYSAIASPSGPGCFTIHFGEFDIVFPTALDNWESIRQVGIWGSETSTDPNYFFGGFELSPALNLSAGERLSFKNNGVADTAKAIRINHTSSGGAEAASGVNTAAETGDSGGTGYDFRWSSVLNSSGATYPTLRSHSTFLPMEVINMSLSNDLWVDWLATDPAASYIQNWTTFQSIDTTNFSLTATDFPAPAGHRLLFRNEKVLVFSPASQNQYINTIGVTLTDISTVERRAWGGGLVDNAPVTVLTGETPIIEVHGFSSTMLTQGQTP